MHTKKSADTLRPLSKEGFCFNEKNKEIAEKILAKYPSKQSAVVPFLDLAQRQLGGCLSADNLSVSPIEYVANYLDMPYIRVYEIATFYSMFHLKKVGKYHLQVCGTTPCWLRGSKEIINKLEQILKIKCASSTSSPCNASSNLTEDGLFSLEEVECLGACVNAPVVQINDEYYEDLTPEAIEELIKNIQSTHPLSKHSDST